MITGLGFSEIILVGMIVLLFFGSKELPRFIRDGAKLLAKVRKYSDKVRRELNEVSRSIDNEITSITKQSVPVERTEDKKKKIRQSVLPSLKKLIAEERNIEQQKLYEHLFSSEHYLKARAVCVYFSVGWEVSTTAIQKKILEDSKRLIIPYCIIGPNTLGIAEVKDVSKDIAVGQYGIHEPIKDIRNNFLKSDIELILCPGVAFDKYGGRLGRGKGFYDRFLEELKNHSCIWGLAFKEQVVDEPLPFAYHDITMDDVVTADGFLLRNAEREIDTNDQDEQLKEDKKYV